MSHFASDALLTRLQWEPRSVYTFSNKRKCCWKHPDRSKAGEWFGWGLRYSFRTATSLSVCAHSFPRPNFHVITVKGDHDIQGQATE
ncbi:hypothetical protein BJX64DRAFT_74211 [Aspergillus heterothallicus]